MLSQLDDARAIDDLRSSAQYEVNCTPISRDPAPAAYLLEHDQAVKQPDTISPNSAHLSPINPEQLNDLLTSF